MALYNALIKSMPQENHHGRVTGKVLLTNLTILPPKWTILFRGKYLSRDVNMAKLLCSPKDPIIIYKGFVKLPGFQTDFSRASSSQENSNVNLTEQIAKESREPSQDIKLTDDDRVEKNCKLGAEVETGNLNPGLRITEFYKICVDGKGSTDKMVFVNTKKPEYTHAYGEYSGVVRIRRKNREKIIKATSRDTVGFLKQRICATFKVDAEKHNIFYLGTKRVDSEMLEIQGFRKGLIVKLDFIRKPEEILEGGEEKEVVRWRARLEQRERWEEEEKQLELEMLGWSEKEKLKWSEQEKEHNQWQEIERSMVEARDRGAGGGPCVRRQMTSFKAQNVKRRALTLVGEKPKYTWNLYSFGMNLYGTCSNTRCVSRKKAVKNENGVSHIAGYGNIILTPERVKFPCSACKELFPVKEFVLCSGRALFRFKKSGVGEEVETVVIESEDDLMKHKTFDDTAEGKGVERSSYDFIEITTVKVGYGVYCCIKCNEMIKFKQDENVLRCGHVYHNECTTVYVGGDEDDSVVGCDACNAEEVESIYDMLGVERENSNSGAALMRSN